ncbi:hypothetical protein [Arsenicicoccus dermatophilus]|uniref:hypothetical protein n=1 Tax=Arsenicicoccus dermatophilus TaxID=1076331 RepID=UPI003917435A
MTTLDSPSRDVSGLGWGDVRRAAARLWHTLVLAARIVAAVGGWVGRSYVYGLLVVFACVVVRLGVMSRQVVQPGDGGDLADR